MNRLLDGISQVVEPGSEDDSNQRLAERGYFLPDRLRGCVDLFKGNKILHLHLPV
jgi:hypothetical protein